MIAFESHDTLIAHEGPDCDYLYREELADGMKQSVVVVCDLGDPMAREAAIVMYGTNSEVIEKLCELAEGDDEPATLKFCLPRNDARSVFQGLPDEDRTLLEEPIPEDCYVLIVLAADRVALYGRKATR